MNVGEVWDAATQKQRLRAADDAAELDDDAIRALQHAARVEADEPDVEGIERDTFDDLVKRELLGRTIFGTWAVTVKGTLVLAYVQRERAAGSAFL